jgi:phage gpG-like protein
MTAAIYDDVGSLFADLQTAFQDIDYKPLLETFMPQLAEYEAGMFAGEYDSNLNDWAPLKKSTIDRKGHDRILVETGALRESLVHIGGAGNIHEVFDHGLTFGTDVEYAHFHQDGTSRMPARPPVGISEETLDKFCDQIANHVVENLKG